MVQIGQTMKLGLLEEFGVYNDRLYLKKNDKPCSSRALFFCRNPNASWKSISEHIAFFPGEPEFVMCQFSPFCYPEVKENKMKRFNYTYSL